MPIKNLICPDGQLIDKQECFKSCRMGDRCIELPALRAAIVERQWTGKPSVTQLIKPTLPAYLEIKKDYSVNPMKQVSSMIGTNSHSLMEGNVPNGWLSEVRLADDICSGQFDAYDCLNKTLVDWKFFGSFRISRALGYKGIWTKGKYVKGAKKGQDKWEQKYSPGHVKDIMEIAIQLSYYKILMEKHNLPVDKIVVQMFIREGLNAAAKSFGLTTYAYKIPIFPLSYHWVRPYMVEKHRRLMTALDTDVLPPICSKTQRWDNSKSYPDRKCRDWCNSNVNCPYYQENYMK